MRVRARSRVRIRIGVLLLIFLLLLLIFLILIFILLLILLSLSLPTPDRAGFIGPGQGVQKLSAAVAMAAAVGAVRARELRAAMADRQPGVDLLLRGQRS